METLKKIVVVVIFAFAFNGANGQSQAAKELAYTKSYESEQAKSYTLAIANLKSVYNAEDYTANIRMGWLHYLAKQYTESIKYYNMAIALKPYAIEAHFGCIKPLSALESWEKVRQHYVQILTIDPQNTIANYWLGVIYYNRKDYVSAQKLFEKVVNLYPVDYDSAIMLAWTKLNLGKTADARVLFNHALIIRPNDSSALAGLKLLK
jgi:tetratricopeptide (TPR) repeat protein